MSEIDLTEAMEEAQDDLIRMFGEAVRAHRSEPAVDLANGSTVFPYPIAQVLVEKVAPLIERQVREQIARDIETYDGPSPWDIGIAAKPESIGHWIASEDCALAARIARGGAS